MVDKLTLLPSKQILQGGRKICFDFTLEPWKCEFTSLRCCTWPVAWLSFCMLSSVAHTGCFKALDSSLTLLGPFQLKISCEFIVVFYESQEKMWWWALWTAVCLLLSWCNGFLLKQTSPASCFAALSSPGVLYIELGAGKGFLLCVLWAWAIHMGSWGFPLHLLMDSCTAKV